MGAGCPPSTPLGVGASYRSPQVGNGYGIRRSPSAHQTPERVGASYRSPQVGNRYGKSLSSPVSLAGESGRLRCSPPSREVVCRRYRANSTEHTVSTSLQANIFLCTIPPARSGLSSAVVRSHCSPARCSHRPPVAPPSPGRPAFSTFPLHPLGHARAATKPNAQLPRP
jgi:hypothetical protein